MGLWGSGDTGTWPSPQPLPCALKFPALTTGWVKKFLHGASVQEGVKRGVCFHGSLGLEWLELGGLDGIGGAMQLFLEKV